MDPLSPLIAALHAEGRLRVWSLVITVMGDVAQPHGGRIPFPVLQAILERLGVEPGALRTAMSRLVADGWLTRGRVGRTSHYALSPRGLAEYGPAAARIYSTAPPQPETWTIALTGADESEGIPLAGGLCLFPGHAPDGVVIAVEGRLRIAPDAGERFIAADHRAALARLTDDLATLDDADPDPLDAMAARVLLMHRWRRIVLRYPALPDCLLPKGCTNLHDRVAAAYRRLVTPSELWLKSGSANGFTAQGSAETTLQRRFVRN